MAATDDTAPIELATGRRRSLRGGDDDPPEPREHSSSSLIRGIVEDVISVGKTADPDEAQLERLRQDVKVLSTLAEAGAKALDRAVSGSGGGGRGSNLLTMFLALIIASATSLGLPAITQNDDVARASVQAEQATAAVTSLGSRLDGIEAKHATDEAARRRVDALTVRWLGDNHANSCKGQKALGRAIAALSKHKKGDPAVEIECDAASLPPELVELVAKLEISESRQ